MTTLIPFTPSSLLQFLSFLIRASTCFISSTEGREFHKSLTEGREFHLLYLLGRPTSDVGVQRRVRIGDVEPPLMPTLQRRLEAKTKVIIASPLAELETGTLYHTDLAALL